MRKRSILLMVLMFIGVTGMACSFSSLMQSNAKQSGDVLFRDDFSDPKSGWDTWSDDGSIVSYQDGGLRMVVNETQFDYWSRPGKRFNDARIAVEATRISGPNDNDFGIICRYKDQDNFYAFLASSDGYVGIMKVKGGNYQLISGDMLEYNETIRTGKATNYLGVDCVGSKLIFYANGKKLLEAQDLDFIGGEVGLITGTYSTPGTEILFDNFTVSVP